eukprot:c11446_g1_i4.p1 GENE.c11446_g1_i4~~c11446_g1_i4.p1  ORF type:complete len:256 (+),score=53.34 c11446_g1_i4:45-812(+)
MRARSAVSILTAQTCHFRTALSRPALNVGTRFYSQISGHPLGAINPEKNPVHALASATFHLSAQHADFLTSNFPAIRAFISQWMPSMFASSLRVPDETMERENIEQGAVFAFENFMVALAQADSVYVQQNCSESLSTALEQMFAHVRQGKIELTLSKTPNFPSPTASIVNTYSFASSDINLVGIAFVVAVSSPLALHARVVDHADSDIGPLTPVPLHDAASSLHLYRMLNPTLASFVGDQWKLTHDPRVLGPSEV